MVRKLGLALVLFAQLQFLFPEANIGYLPSERLYTAAPETDISIVVVLDLSYSMRLPVAASDKRRIDEARGAVSELLSSHVTNSEWALFTFSDKNTIRLALPFTTQSAIGVLDVSHLEPFGISPIGDALERAANYAAEHAAGQQRAIVLVSDGIETERYALPAADRFLSAAIRIHLLGFAIEENPLTLKPIERLVGATGGKAYHVRQAADLVKALKHPVQTQRVSVNTGPPDLQLNTELSSPGRQLALQPVWFMLPVLALLTGLLGRKLLKRQSQRRRIHSVQTSPIVCLQVRKPDRTQHTSGFSRLPLTVGAHDSADLQLSTQNTTIKAPEAGFQISLSDGTPCFVSKRLTNINGVGCRRKALRQGDVIAFGDHRITYSGMQAQAEPEQLPKARLRIEVSLLMVALVAVLAFRHPLAISYPATPDAAFALDSAPGAMNAAVHDAADQALTTVFHTPADPMPTSLPSVIKAGDLVHFEPTDVLFIHAHPDDESIDYGVLMAQLARRNQSIVMLTLTRGESGLDQFPRRRTDHAYPGHDLAGAELAAVRIREETRALGVLGAQTFISAGLKNHPFDSITQILLLEQILWDWGGEVFLVQWLADLIEGYAPDIVVSPDSQHGGSNEHFEHDAVGYLTHRALARLQATGKHRVKAHLVSVDPRFRDSYAELLRIDGMAIDPVSGLTYREIQMKALKEHDTQRDAAVIAVETVTNYRWEYYSVRFWHLDQDIQSYVQM